MREHWHIPKAGYIFLNAPGLFPSLHIKHDQCSYLAFLTSVLSVYQIKKTEYSEYSVLD